MSTPSDFERVGEARLRQIIDEFVAEMVGDTMIGYFFATTDTAKLAQHEYQFTARALGAQLAYEGKPIRRAHAGHRIMGGQFARRAWILRQTFERHGVDADIVGRLMAHIEKLRPLVTAQPGSSCLSGDDGGPLISSWAPADGDDSAQ
ncbi:MAG: group 1 truncated hemoglobin [Myxococcales bacterium]|nr:group 1 truncated hemoglobin [Myxococcales bacterium]